MPESRANRERLRRLMSGWTGYCVWCHEPIAIRQWVEENFVVVCASHGTITYLHDGETVKARLATLDHIIPRRDGGTNYFENLAPACYACNNKRTANISQWIGRPCVRCGGVKANMQKRKHCRNCSRELIEAWRAAHPEDFLPDPDFP